MNKTQERIARAVKASRVENLNQNESRALFNGGIDNVAYNLAREFSISDSHFHYDGFLEACGVKPKVG